MSTSLKVVSMAHVFWASFSLWAILSLIRFIFTWGQRTEDRGGTLGDGYTSAEPLNSSVETPGE